jgi:hypothetical protein
MMESTAQEVSDCGQSRNSQKCRKQPDLPKHSQNSSASPFISPSEIQRTRTVRNHDRAAAHTIETHVSAFSQCFGSKRIGGRDLAKRLRCSPIYP